MTWQSVKNNAGEVGRWYSSDENSIRKSVSGWYKGKMHGRWIKWFRDGSINFYKEYKNGLLHGEFKEWSKYEKKLITDQIWAESKLVKDNLKGKEDG
ncbi:MAG: hypothetical protein ACFFC1_20450 [Promethearchaeota archaeon]